MTGREALVFLIALAAASTLFITTCRADDPRVIHIQGKVVCTDCSKDWNEWVNGAKPLQGSKVAVICMDNNDRVVYHTMNITNEEGMFKLIVDRHINGKKLMVNGCVVKLVSSTHSDCNVLTDFSGGKTGVKLRSPSLVYQDITEYTIPPFSFTSPMCDDKDIDKQITIDVGNTKLKLNPNGSNRNYLT